MAACDKPYTVSDKWTASLTAGLLFGIISSPYTYSLTNKLSEAAGVTILSPAGTPTVIGLLAHGFVFVMIIRLLINRSNNGCIKPYTSIDKWIVAAIGGLLFVVLSSPFLYDSINSLTTMINVHTSVNGQPTPIGLGVHTAIFTLVTRLLMR